MSTSTDYGKVAVLMGGLSAERDISLKSGQAVLQALKANGIEAHALDVSSNVIQQLIAGNFDRVFNMLHGRGGEDGVIQGALELLGIPYTGSNVLASALGMDKLKTKEIWVANKLLTPDYCIIDKNTALNTVLDQLTLPVIIKPLNEGSSLGMSKVTVPDEWQAAVAKALQYDDVVFAEQWISGEEYTVGILGNDALPAIRLETSNVFYDYEAKYLSDKTRYHCPCGLSEEKENTLQKLALKAFKAIGATDWGRVDMIMDKRGKVFLIEVNTLPGMTDHSLVPIAAKQAGIEFKQLVMSILEQSVRGH
ncbi:MAG TPA: D-alanine--D-alanine ligase [Gammaproteobacteria bacterium]|nr:D-alanine--D-alanine ligase [Gammaproteobacteria bacterium]